MAILGVKSTLGKIVDLIGSVHGALHVKSFPSALTWLLTTQTTVSTTSIALTSTVPSNAYYAYVQVVTSGIYYSVNSNRATPSSTVGHEANAGDDLHLYGKRDLDNFRAVRQGGTDATLKVSYYSEVQAEVG